jgi:toxin YhaV
VLAWVNDEESLRTYESKTDAYAVFKKMIDLTLKDNSMAHP